MENQIATDEPPKRKRRSGWDAVAPVSTDIPAIPQQPSYSGSLIYKYLLNLF